MSTIRAAQRDDLAATAEWPPDAADIRESEDRFRTAFDDAPIGMSLVDPDGRFLRVNRALCEITGYDEAAMLSLTFQAITHADDLDRDVELSRRVLGGELRSYEVEKRYVHRRGHDVWVSLAVSLVRSPDGSPRYFICQVQDVTDRKHVQAALHEREEFTREVLDSLDAATAVLDEAGAIVKVNRAWRRFLEQMGHGDTDVLDVNYLDVCDRATGPDAEYAREAARGIRDVLGGRAPDFHLDYPCHLQDETRWFTLRVSPLSSPHRGVVVFHVDITERKAVEAQLAYQALHDPLTGLPNRTLFVDRLGQALARLNRGSASVAVLCLDLDRFKVVNESLGHEAGDVLLIEQAMRLRRILRPEDTVARLGGDEFAVLCENVAGQEELDAIAGRISGAISKPLPLDDGEVTITTSIGVSLADDPAAVPESMLRDADAAMYHAKELGRNRCEMFDERLRHRAVNRLRTESGLRAALERDELRLVYQPQVRLATGEIVGMEALVRWEHPERGLLPPSEFMEVAEESGLIVPIGEWVIREACRQADRWQALRPEEPLIMCVNLSAHQLTQPNLPDVVASAFAGTRLYPANLCLEITETVLMAEAESVMEALRALKAVGVGLAIDDFGTGHSSLVYLKRFPVDMLKVDRSFVDGLGKDPEDTAIVTAVLSLAQALGLTAVAEGVETPEQARFLQGLGCRYAQGFHYLEPQSADVMDRLVHATLPREAALAGGAA